jgi:hypothetical protein
MDRDRPPPNAAIDVEAIDGYTVRLPGSPGNRSRRQPLSLAIAFPRWS